MKKLLLLFFVAAHAIAFGQQTFTAKMAGNLLNGRTGKVIVHINYALNQYHSDENDVITAAGADSSTMTYSMHCCIKDSTGTLIDTTFTLSSGQVSNLNSFFQSVNSNTNPNASLSANADAHCAISAMMCCDGQVNTIWPTTVHISMGRYLLASWNNWQ